MRISTLAAGVCAAALLPTAALAQQTCEQRQNSRVAGVAAGAGLGAIAGAAVAGRDDRTKGAVVGGLAGALLGNHLSKGQADCARAYGYYDNDGVWHANAVASTNAAGYFDRAGAWVEGAPQGHYDRDGRWVQTAADSSVAGYHDNNGLWVPASATGYYASDGRWIASAAPGYYDRSGRWIAGPTTGRYDADGRWMAGQAAGRRDSQGRWIADPQPGYYENGRWVRGATVGYYDARGRWIATEDRMQRADREMSGERRSADQRQADISDRITRAMDDGRLSRREGNQALRSLAAIGRDERALRARSGNLRPHERANIHARLDRLSATIRQDVRDRRESDR
jgi:hypothetical protein